LEEILEMTGLGQVLEDFTDGLSTEINQFGLPLSQGNRITLAIARSLVSQPRILMIDEALSSLDKSAQIGFLKKIDRISAGKTLLVVSHEMRLIQSFDQIAVLDKGAVVGFGKHDSLLENCDTYKMLWNMDQQLSNPDIISSDIPA
jgi:ATP-binding cassette subfamily B protein